MIKHSKVIHWFRQDLRLGDNPGLLEAAKRGTVIPVYIWDESPAGAFARGAASRWWLLQSLKTLNVALGGKLCVYAGNAETILEELCTRLGCERVTWNRCYEPWRRAQDLQVEKGLQRRGVSVFQGTGALLREPWDVLKDDGTTYKVFTAFYKKGYASGFWPEAPLGMPESLVTERDPESTLSVDDLGLVSAHPWSQKLGVYWTVGEAAAQQRLGEFLETGLPFYEDGRNFPAQPWVSRLSPYLHFGEISPRQVMARLSGAEANKRFPQAAETFYKELVWREFSAYLLHHFPGLPTENFQPKFDRFDWVNSPERLKKWQRGETGVPIVDAGMRELWETGYMHNRVRMIAASFLVKHLRIDWREGQAWFWDCLVDADLANNSASWQWVAGSGADAAPYFRIFNPITQAEKFDPKSVYLKKYGSTKTSFSPPNPIVDLKKAREESLRAYAELKE